VRISFRVALVGLVLAALGSGAALGAPTGRDAVRAPVIKLKHARFGNVLARRDHQALYYWNVEKRDFKVHCTGACARAWPPLIVRTRSAVPRRVAGIRARSGRSAAPTGGSR
jgi:predicted lipoprotein with Yx(FWY)xxD motif